MRARYPDHAGFVERDGTKVAFEVFGRGGPAVLLVPASPISHARSWKGMVPFLSRHFTVVVTDGRGTHHSDRPHRRECYSPDEVDADLVAVLDAAGVDRAVVVAHCHATQWAMRFADAHADLVAGLVLIAPGVAAAPGYDYASASERDWQIERLDASGWSMRNRAFWRTDGGYRAWVEFFFDQQLPEPHSTKQLEDTVMWALDTEVEAMIAEREGRAACGADAADELCRRLQHRQPVLVLHGSDDRCQPLERGRRVAELTGGELVVLDGSGHLPHVRDPVTVNQLVVDFVEEATGASVRTKVWSRGLSRRKRVLYLSSPIGLGHARRDVAVAKELHRLRPEV
jgi:pimeloyl-ACP methyl ester carboxylesterase